MKAQEIREHFSSDFFLRVLFQNILSYAKLRKAKNDYKNTLYIEETATRKELRT